MDPDRIPRRGSRFWRWFGRTYLRLAGWKIEGHLPNLARFVIAVAPHTSNWDFAHGVAAMFALDFRLSYIGKHTLFRPPFGALFRWTGGIPVDRSVTNGLVDSSIRAFANSDQLALVIAPQGTRRPVPHFKTGFLRIARGAGVPVLYAALDYGTRSVRLGPLVFPGEDIEAERERAERHFSAFQGKRPR
jgi:1-acyl-sn-glycerol-3-phosphate acyltransferase